MTEKDHTTLITFSYWDLIWGGLFDGRSHDNLTHLVAQWPKPKHGTPGPTLCGVDRFAEGGPGGAWCRKPTHSVCGNCVEALRLRIEAQWDS